MHKTFKMTMILLISLLLYGCPTTYKFGQKFEKKNIEQIKIGHTTQAEVVKLFGTPWREGSANGLVVFTYSYEDVVFESNNKVKKTGDTLVIYWNRNV